MKTLTFIVPESLDISKFESLLASVGITKQNLDFIPLNEAIQELFPDDTPEEIAGMILKEARTDKGMTQQKLAENIGTSKTAISAMENGKRPISKDMAKKFGNLFQMDYKVFI